MSIVIVSDVFGMTPALIKLKEELGANAIVDPYQGKCMDFKDEADAYAYFVTTVGLDNYVSTVLKFLTSFDSQTTLIGFSVGASAIWRLSINSHSNLVKQAFCFYGSQIRNFTQIVPCFKINAIFPKSESHFDVIELMKKLESKSQVTVTQVEYLHGFMNICSSNFNVIGYQHHINLLRSTIS